MNKDRRRAIEAIKGKIEDLRMQSEQLAQKVQDIVITLTGIAKGLDPDIFRDLAGAEIE